jgi:hypothetical protein
VFYFISLISSEVGPLFKCLLPICISSSVICLYTFSFLLDFEKSFYWGWAWYHMPGFPTTQRQRLGGLWFEASPGENKTPSINKPVQWHAPVVPDMPKGRM